MTVLNFLKIRYLLKSNFNNYRGFMIRTLTFLLVILSVIFFCKVSFAQTPEITNGLNYLFATQNPDGSWNGTFERGPFSATVNVIETLAILGQGNTAAYSNAVSWLQSQTLETTEELSDRINILSSADADRDLLISYLDAMSGAWGGHADYNINNLDTSLAIRALKKINYQDLNMIYFGIDYLISTQNSDGGWGLQQGMDSEVYYTSLFSKTLEQFPRTTSIATAINKATTYLLAHQNVGTP